VPEPWFAWSSVVFRRPLVQVATKVFAPRCSARWQAPEKRSCDPGQAFTPPAPTPLDLTAFRWACHRSFPAFASGFSASGNIPGNVSNLAETEPLLQGWISPIQ